MRVILGIGSCIIERSAVVQLNQGLNEIVIEPTERIIDVLSISIDNGRIVGVSFKNVKKPITVVSGLIAELTDRVRKIRGKVNELLQKKELIRSELDGISTAIRRIYSLHAREYYKIGGDDEKISSLISRLSKHAMTKREELTEIENTLDNLRAELEALEKEYSQLRGKTVDAGQIKVLVVSEQKTNAELRIQFLSDVASWKPYYVLEITRKEDRREYLLRHRIHAYQKSPITWENINVEFTTRTPQMIEFREPEPWFIRPIVERRKEHRVAPEKRTILMALSPPAKRKVEVGPSIEMTWSPEGHATFRLERKITIPPEAPISIDLASVRLACRAYYLWDAFRGRNVFEVIEFENRGLDILNGECMVIRDGNLVNRFHTKTIPIGTKARWIVAKEEKIKTRRKLVSREERTKGIIGEKAYIKLVYELRAKNTMEIRADIEIYDRIPIPKDPKIEVKDIFTEPRAEIDKMGITKWGLELEPREERTLRIGYTILFPPDYRIPI